MEEWKTPWKNLQPNLPPEVQEISTKVAEGLDAVKTGLEAARVIINITQSLIQTQGSTAVTLTNQAIRLVIETLQGVINSFLDDTGAYVLLVPLPKKGLVAIASQPDTPDEPGSNYVGFPDSALLSYLPAAQAASLRSSPAFAAIFNSRDLSIGGNAYLVKTIASSIYDSGDRNRPKFTGESYWAYGLAVAGAPDMTSVLGALTFLDRFFAPPHSANTVTASRGILDLVPSQVRAAPSGRGRLPVIEWERVPASTALRGFDGSTLVARKYAVIRTKDFRTKTATTILDLFPTAEIREDMTGPGGAKVLTISDYDGLVNRYIDTDTLEAGVTYYYFVAFKGRINNNMAGADSGNDGPRSPGQDASTPAPEYVDLPFGLISSCAEWRPPTSSNQLSSTRLSKAPDWYRTPSVATVLPGVEKFLDLISEVLENFRIASAGITGRTQQYLNQISEQITQIQRKADDLDSVLAKLNALSSNLNTGIYGTARAGQGSASLFLADVVQAIDDPSDPDRPPFDMGDEYVVAALVLVVSPDAAVIETVKGLLELIFGGANTSPVTEGIDSVRTSLAQVEQALIDRVSGGGTAPAAAPLAFDSNMSPRPLGEPDASCE